MTEAELILADLVLMKLPVGRQLEINGFMGPHLFEGKQDKIPQRTTEEISKIIALRSDAIRTFLLKEKYITTVNYMIPWDVMTDKGEKAQELGGHEKYLDWENKKNTIKKIKNCAFWATFGLAFLSALYTVLGYYSNGEKTSSQPSRTPLKTQPQSPILQKQQTPTQPSKDSQMNPVSLDEKKDETKLKDTSVIKSAKKH